MPEINPDNFYELRNKYYNFFSKTPPSEYIDKYAKADLINVLNKIVDKGLPIKSEAFNKIIQNVSNENHYISKNIASTCLKIISEHSKIDPVKNNLLDEIGNIKPEVEKMVEEREWFHYIGPSASENLKLIIGVPGYQICDEVEKFHDIIDKELDDIGLRGHYELIAVYDS
jgi:hypothetical protein